VAVEGKGGPYDALRGTPCGKKGKKGGRVLTARTEGKKKPPELLTTKKEEVAIGPRSAVGKGGKK